MELNGWLAIPRGQIPKYSQNYSLIMETVPKDAWMCSFFKPSVIISVHAQRPATCDFYRCIIRDRAFIACLSNWGCFPICSPCTRLKSALWPGMSPDNVWFFCLNTVSRKRPKRLPFWTVQFGTRCPCICRGRLRMEKMISHDLKTSGPKILRFLWRIQMWEERLGVTLVFKDFIKCQFISGGKKWIVLFKFIFPPQDGAVCYCSAWCRIISSILLYFSTSGGFTLDFLFSFFFGVLNSESGNADRSRDWVSQNYNAATNTRFSKKNKRKKKNPEYCNVTLVPHSASV